MALRLHAITLADAAQHIPVGDDDGKGERDGGASGIALIPFRDLCAVVSHQRSFVLEEATPALIEEHRRVVDRIFHQASVVPAPVGVVFRTPEVLKRWMELHYVSLSGALEFVEDRAVARVHIVRANAKDKDEREAGSDLAAAATEAFRALRRHAVAAVPLRLEHLTGLVLSASFLVERDLWKEFLRAVDEQHNAHHLLRFDVTGPWAPYDFVRMQFGG